MNTNTKWAIATLAAVAVTATATWFIAKNNQSVTTPTKDGDKSAKADDKKSDKKDDKKNEPKEDTVKLVVAVAKSLAHFPTQAKPSMLARMMDNEDLKTDKGKKIEIVRMPMTSAEIIDGMQHGTLKAHIIIPANDIYLDLLDRDWTLRTGKPLTSERAVLIKQPYVLAVRRAKAEAMGWPKKDIGWAEVVEVARDGWKAVGKPEWGSLKMLLANPNLSDTGAHAAVSLARGIAGKGKDLTSADLQDPKFQAAIKAIDSAVIWYPSSVDDLLRNEVLTVPARCDMTFLAEHSLLALNENSARHKAPPDWVAIYPTDATIVDGVTAALVQRDWVTDEHRAAAAKIFKDLAGAEFQKKMMSIGYRPALSDIPLGPPLAADVGIDPKLPKLALKMPDVAVVLDCLAGWDASWKSRGAGSGSVSLVSNPSTNMPVNMRKLAHLAPTIQCVRRAKPCTITIWDPETKKVRGTGVIVDPRGYAVTNFHVTGKTKTLGITVLDSKDKMQDGTVVSVDPDSDLALIRLAPGKYPAIKLSDPSGVEVGASVVVIGNPLGYTGTVTVGIISAMDREIPLASEAILKNVIQTDAGINPGNSGGPLLDLDGDLLGIVFAIRDGAQNIGFAIPGDRVRAYIKKNVPQ